MCPSLCEGKPAPLWYIRKAWRNPPPCDLSCHWPWTEWTRLNDVCVRCKPCNKSHSALQRLFAKEPSLREEFKEKFQAADGSRTAFMLRARGLPGDEVKALVRTVLTETTTQTNSLKRKQHVEYLDEADLKKRLVHKPDQVQRILEKGPLFEHPETGAQMYTFRTFTQASNPLLLCYVLDDSVALLSIEV